MPNHHEDFVERLDAVRPEGARLAQVDYLGDERHAELHVLRHVEFGEGVAQERLDAGCKHVACDAVGGEDDLRLWGVVLCAGEGAVSALRCVIARCRRELWRGGAGCVR